MPSLQDALLNAINKPVQQPVPTLRETLNALEQDDQPTTKEKTMANPSPVVVINNGTPRFGISNNVSRATFDYVRDNPGKTRKEIVKGLVANGFKVTSVSSLINQLMITGQIARTEAGFLVTTTSGYKPINSSALKKIRATTKTAKVKAARVEKRAAKKPPAQSQATVAQHSIAKEEPKQKYQPKEAAGIAALSQTSVPLVDLTAEKILDGLGVRQAKVLYAELKKIFEE
jgi:hypothetical protein